MLLQPATKGRGLFILTRSVDIVEEDDAASRGEVSLVSVNIDDAELAISKHSARHRPAEVQHPINLEVYPDGIGETSIGLIGNTGTHTQAHITGQSSGIDEIHLPPQIHIPVD